ncbi:MAG: hypothetical protein PVH31_01980 [Ectothiorhodospiraceae bacterium]
MLEEGFIRRYRLPMLPTVGLLVVAWTPVLATAVPNAPTWPFAALLCAPAVLALLILWFFGIVEVAPTGIRLFRGARIPWQEIRGLRRHRVTGLPFLILYRALEPPLWVPLFFRGKGRMDETIQAYWGGGKGPPQEGTG